MGIRRNKIPATPDLNLDPIGADLPPLEFKGKKRLSKGRKEKPYDTKGRRYK